MTTSELLLIDLSSLAHPLYHMSSNEPDPNWTSNQIVARVRALSSQHPHTAICCDAGRSFRHDLAPRVSVGEGKYEGYKANRPERDARLTHQIDTAIARLREDGYPIWKAENAEADDVIATATAKALAIDGATVLIATADKDLLQLVNDRVRVKNVAPNANGEVRDVEAVVAKFGVRPDQMLDWLCLVGDSSDNVKGANGVGAVKATELLRAHGTLRSVYEAMNNGVVKGITPALRTNLMEFRERWPLTRQLIALKSDVEIPFAEIAAEREAKPMEETPMVDESREELSIADVAEFVVEEGPSKYAVQHDGRELRTAEATDALGAATARVAERIKTTDAAGVSRPSVHDAERASVALVPLDFSQQLEPRNMEEALRLANHMFKSRIFSAYGTAEAVFSTIIAGRELGIPAMASLRAFHIIEGKPTLSAGTIQAMVLKSGKARYFRCSERTPLRATFVTQRGDEPEMALSYTIEEGRAAFQGNDAKWAASGWGRNPADMLVARASSKLARLVYPDVVSGLYAPEEME